MSTSPGVLYYTSREGDAGDAFSAIDIATQTEIYTVIPEEAGSFRYAMYEPNSGYVFVGQGSDAWIFDAATGEAVDADGNPDNGTSSISHESCNAHSVVMTPF
jgi:hypothetical protein